MVVTKRCWARKTIGRGFKMFPRSVFFSMGLTCTTPWMDSVGCNDVAIENWFKKHLSEKTKKQLSIQIDACFYVFFLNLF